jgi:hypothetical protein
MTRLFNYFDNWKNEALTCEQCGRKWKLDLKRADEYEQPLEFRCPACDAVLAIVNFPTVDEMKENWDKLSPSEKELCSTAEDLDRDFAITNLNSPAQLPDIEAEQIILVWDVEPELGDVSGEPKYVTIKHQGQSIWKERAFFECVGRFDEVVDVLKKKYGNRLKDLLPSSASLTFLGGDDLSAWDKLAKIRSRMEPGFVDDSDGLDALARAGDREALNTIRYQREYPLQRLQRPDQLPAIKCRSFLVTWDIAEDPPRVQCHATDNSVRFDWNKEEGNGFLFLTLHRDEQLLWREPASNADRQGKDGKRHWDIVDRYVEIAEILRSRYGAKIKDLVPTSRSQAYVGGLPWDDINKERKRLFPADTRPSSSAAVPPNQPRSSQ